MQFQQEKIQLNLQKKCAFCSAPYKNIITDFKQGVIVCTNCGFIQQERFIDYSAEWNNFQDDGNATGVDPSRVSGCPVNLEENDNGLGIDIIPCGKLGKQFKSVLQYQYYQTHEQLRSAKIISSIKKWGQRLSQSQQVIQDSILVFKQIAQKPEKIKGKNNFYLVLGILVMQMRISGANVLSIDSIAQITGKNTEKVSRAIKFINELWTSDKKIIVSNTNLANEIAQKLELPIFINIQSQKIADKIIELGHLEGKNPKTIALVAIYIACQLTKNGVTKPLSVISSITGVSKVTIQKSYQIVHQYLDEIIHSWEGRLPLQFLPSQAH